MEDMKSDIEEVCIVAKKVYEWKCLITNQKAVGPRLIRWDPTKPASLDNLTLMGKPAYENHCKLANLAESGYSQEIQQRFEEKARYSVEVYKSGYMMFI